MTLMPGERLDSTSADLRLRRLYASGNMLRRLHKQHPPVALPPAPDDARIIARYKDAAGPPLPLAVPPASPAVFCHGDWTDGNLLVVGTGITAIIDWEAAHLGDPLRELSRAAWGASSKMSGQSMHWSRVTERTPGLYVHGSRSTPPNSGCGSPRQGHPSTWSSSRTSSRGGQMPDLFARPRASNLASQADVSCGTHAVDHPLARASPAVQHGSRSR
jgi:hypothetical protein